MTKFLFRAAVSCVALVAASGLANAADMNRKAPVAAPYVAPVTAYNWTGFYAGANMGADWFRSKVDVPGASGNNNPTAFIGGLQAGYNFQTGPWVIGAEVDVDYTHASKTSLIGPEVVKSQKDWSGTARLRGGYAYDRLFVFGTGGLAWANYKLEDTNVATGALTTKNQTRAGWTVGAGAEYAVYQNISLKGEYLYADYGHANVGSTRQNLTDHQLRVGVNYKF